MVMNPNFKPKFQEGDVVKFKSGGPKMTVDKYHKGDVIKCTWCVGGEVKRDYFKEGLLVLVNIDDEKSTAENKEKVVK
jgi:uncharacterized protein YodC (DUF2158 family)